MDRLATRVATRYRLAESVGDPKYLLSQFEQVVHNIVQLMPQNDIDRVKKTCLDLIAVNPSSTDTSSEDIRTAMKALVVAEKGYEITSTVGHKLFLSILQSYSLPPALRKKVEIASRVHMKPTKPRPKKDPGPQRYINYLEAYEKLVATLQAHVEIAEAAVAQGKPREAEGEGATKFKVGSFTLVNTGGFSAEVMTNVADAMQKVEAFATKARFGSVCYGDVQVTNRISGGRVLAFYHHESDEIFVRADVKGSHDTVRNILHELGHRYEGKRLSGKKGEIESVYAQIHREEFARKLDREKMDALKPQPGEEITEKGKTYRVIGTEYLGWNRGYKVNLQKADDPNARAHVSLEDYIEMKGGKFRDVEEPDFKGFVTDYAKKGGPSENFAEMFSFYCMGRLPAAQKPLFEGLAF
jgi:hypothetical protein